MLVTRPMIGKMIDKIGAKSVVMISLVFPLILITDKTSLIWISIVLFIRCTSIGGNLPLASDAYTGLDRKQLPEAGVGINNIENPGSSFGSVVIATVGATVMEGLQPTIANSLKGYHAGFLVSTIVLAIIFIPHIKKPNKQMLTGEVYTLQEHSKLADLFHTGKLHQAEDAPVTQPN